MREPITLKFAWSNFITPPICLHGVVAMATPVAQQQRSQSSRLLVCLKDKIMVAIWQRQIIQQ